MEFVFSELVLITFGFLVWFLFGLVWFFIVAVWSCLHFFSSQVVDMALAMEVISLLEKTAVTKEALEVSF